MFTYFWILFLSLRTDNLFIGVFDFSLVMRPEDEESFLSLIPFGLIPGFPLVLEDGFDFRLFDGFDRETFGAVFVMGLVVD